MKVFNLLLLLTLCSVVSGKTYYVAPNGNDVKNGTIDAPWATWYKAISTAKAGDTVYFRGGIYFTTSSHDFTVNGTKDNPICLFNYPGEVPILDGINKTTTSSGLGFTYSTNLHIKGLTIRNNLQLEAGNKNGNNWVFFKCNNITIENCVSYNAGYRGFWFLSVDSMYVYNCDSYNAADSLSASPGNAGDGFILNDSDIASDTTTYVIFRRCRSWHNSDDGFDIETQGYAELDNCWSFNNGYLAGGNGCGFKLSLTRSFLLNRVTRRITNCISAYNAAFGFDTNDNGTTPEYITAYNNTSYRNGYKGKTAYGYVVRNTSGTTEQELNRIFRNNIAYDNEHGSMLVVSGASYTHSNNSWDSSPSITITDEDFLSIDSTGLTAPRDKDGLLLNLNFLKLSIGSDLIDAGTDVGLVINGTPPDLGAFESIEVNPNLTQITSIVVTGAGGATTITSDDGSLQLSVAILPSNATNKTVTWSVVNGTGQATISSTGLVSAVANGTVTARASANDGSGIVGSIVITISNQVIRVTGITVSGAGGATTITSDDGSLQLSAAIFPSNATNKTVTWSVVNGTGQATISSTGLVSAVANGTVTARASANDGSGIVGSIVITISNQVIRVTGITVSGAGGATTITSDDGSLQLSAAIFPSNATNKTVTWSVVNGTGQATISSTGLVSAVANGTITARASANDGSGIVGSIVITISNQVIRVTGITVSGAGGAATITSDDGSLQLSAAIFPSNATNKTVTWSVVNGTGQATISSTGLVSAVANGTVTARASANDGSGIYGTYVITITNQQIPANQPPVVIISSPTKSAAFISPASITIHADAYDPDGIITRVEFYEGNIKLGEVTKDPFDFTWKNVTDGTYSITAVAIDNQNLKTTSASVTVVVDKSTNTVNQLPIISFTSPNNKKKFKKNEKVIIEAVAFDPDGTIAKVEFKCGSTTLCELTTAPYIYSSIDLDTGTYVITAIATDNLGASNTSSDLQFTIDLYHDEYAETVSLYPNPNDGHFAVDFHYPEVNEGKVTITIINLRGEAVFNEILEEASNTKDFDLSGQASGSYILIIKKNNEIIGTKKFIKN